MKTTTKVIFALCLGAVLQAIALAESPAPSESNAIVPVGMPKGGVLLHDHAIKVLTSNTWTWYPAGSPGNWTIKFMPNGTAYNSAGWMARYELKGLREVVIKPKDGAKPGRITFSKDFATYTGHDVGNQGPLEGKLVVPK